MRRVSAVASAFLALVTSGCSSVFDLDTHPGCTAVTGSLWNSKVRFFVNHNDPRSCPVNSPMGSQTSSGGVVKDLTAAYPTVGDANYLRVTVADFATEFINEVFESCAITLGGPVSESFNWSPPLPPPNQNTRDRLAQGYVSYTVGDNPDHVCFEVGFQSTIDRARARININYYGTQFRHGGSSP